jgi:hypothetical protein
VTSTGAAARCPKCDAEVRPDAAACAACGLAAERFDGYERAPAEGPPEVLAAWKVCLDHWDDDAVHDRFRALAAATGAFPFAARLYRQAARERPGDERAATGLARVQRMAEAALLARPAASERAGVEPGGRRHGPYRGVTLVLVVVLLLLTLAGIMATMKTTANLDLEPPASPPSEGRSRAPVVE